MRPYNFLKNLPVDLSQEEIQEILSAPGIRIERIVSRGQVSPPGFWYDQRESEWVMVLQGVARIRFETDNVIVDLAKGDSLHIPAHVMHRVDWTDPEQDTVWLAIFYGLESYQLPEDR